MRTSVRRKARFLAMAFSGILCLMAAGSTAAWSFEVITTQPGIQDEAHAVMRAPQPMEADSCLYILRQAQDRDAMSAREQYYRQSAGSAAAVGLVFGVRFALGPAEVHKKRRTAPSAAAFRVWETRDSTGSGQALAIADYRACRNEQTLRALTD